MTNRKSNSNDSPQGIDVIDRTIPWWTVGGTLVYLGIGSLFAVGTRNWEFVFYILVVIILGLTVLSIRNRAGFTNGLLCLLSIWGFLHVVGGLVPIPEYWPHTSGKPVFYSWDIIPGYLRYDQPVHAFGFAVATWACWQSLVHVLGARPHQTGMLMIAVFAGLGLGALNEVVEFFATLFLETNVGGYENTGWDLVANLVGACTAAILIRFCSRYA